ncbi:hypothetical protein OC846_005196 [Tilletia horrida]|uniref:Phenylalanine ammonia-lyase n=1 Tax=Tilletia horrida TaxID=155126 RepID=A0AAN6JW88_9BASI|nr:hypothetical protein OC846_005196 [Tilletia horrida]KAK0562379.1 hypothetical protein OC861_005354 [Tilletia horrida]
MPSSAAPLLRSNIAALDELNTYKRTAMPAQPHRSPVSAQHSVTDHPSDMTSSPSSSDVSSTGTHGSKFAESIASPTAQSMIRAPRPNAHTVVIDGRSLSIAGLVAVARYRVTPVLDSSKEAAERVQASVDTLNERLARGESLYGINTGFGGSADSRTANTRALQLALLQHQQIGILEVPPSFPSCTPSLPGSSLSLSENVLSMPEAWVRGAMTVRLSSLIRGHSGVRMVVLERLQKLIENNITPVVPVRSSISASGDLSPLSYVAGCLAGQEGIWAWVDGPEDKRIKVPSSLALKRHGIEATQFEPKEALGILNGTAFSCSVGALVLHDAQKLAFLTQVTTAMAVEALLGTDASFAPFIHETARPHPGQVEVASNILAILDGSRLASHAAEEKHVLLSEEAEGALRQDRYPLRTAAQFIGPQIEDILSAAESIQIELNSTTDNPLIDSSTGHVHHGGNFQAMSVTNAMEKSRLALCHLGKITFQQLTELINPAMNRGLAANLAASDPSLNFHCKGIDIASAAAQAELAYLASPVSSHIQSAEMGNQSVNSMALVSGRYTINAVETLSMLHAWMIYALCQAFDLRAVQFEFKLKLAEQIEMSIEKFFSTWINHADQVALAKKIALRLTRRLDETSARDLHSRLTDAYTHAGYELIEYFTSLPSGGGADPLRTIMSWRDYSAEQTAVLHRRVTQKYLDDPRGCHASPLLGRSRSIYQYVRRTLAVPMHGRENALEFVGEEGRMIHTAGGYVSVIYAAIRNGDFYQVTDELARSIAEVSPSPQSRL